MKITTHNQIIPIAELSQFIEEHLKYSANKKDYLAAVNDLKDSQDSSTIQNAIGKVKNLASELGRNILITGLSSIAIDAIKSL